MLNRFHNEVGFPKAFERLRFDMVSDVEYHGAYGFTWPLWRSRYIYIY